ncbi:amidohydrolase [Streptomyces sp. NPDC017979]|uniref:amidohydrolase n=1 Tax=Streptomyces sp. NPDC017979 TaxID=3365024 RepID=UPI00378E44D9
MVRGDGNRVFTMGHMSHDPLSRRRILVSAGAAGAVGVAASLVPQFATAATTRSVPAGRQSAALVIHNARVLTGMRGERVREAIAVGRNGKVLATGSSRDVRRYAGRDTEVVDARQGTVMSGIVDGHAHPVAAGAATLNPSLGYLELTIPQLQELLRGFLADPAYGSEPDGWLVVADWDPVGLLPVGTVAHHRFLDALPTRRPIMITATDGHNSWVNRRALELAGITATTPDPPGGEIERDADGAPTGLLKEEAQGLVHSLVPDLPFTRVVEATAHALAGAAAQGITAFLDASADEWHLDVYTELARTGKLPQRVAAALRLDAHEIREPEEGLRWLEATRRRYKEVDRLDLRTTKVFVDGVMEYPARTAALLDPYLDGHGNPTQHRGQLQLDPADFARLAVLLDRKGWQIHAHAIGDRATRIALDGYETALRTHGRRGNRHTITHLQLVHPTDLRRFAQLDVIASMQLQWAMRDTWTMDALLPYIGPDRHRRLYPARSLERHGALLAGGSDWPIDPLETWNQIRTAIDREGAHSDGPLHPEMEAINRASALRMHTTGATWQLRMDRHMGTLTPGRAADLVLLDRDVTRVPVPEISSTQVRLTLVDGVPVHEEGTATARAARARTENPATGAARRPARANRHQACEAHHHQRPWGGRP